LDFFNAYDVSFACSWFHLASRNEWLYIKVEQDQRKFTARHERISNVFDFMSEEATKFANWDHSEDGLLIPVQRSVVITSVTCALCTRTVQEIRKEKRWISS